ncbi:MAG TPA: hypothetical protein VFE05_22170 [Longimicrobiaceae bacterium]|jgi:hypothetical protein|nr:hypothetical protein [Longimicrobiaceae bacterium]
MNAHLGAALAALGERVPVERVDGVWLFPARQIGERESGLAVLSLFAGDGDAGRRELFTLQYEAERLKGGKTKRTDTLTEQGAVPEDRVGRIIDGVVRRLGGEADVPDMREVAGDAGRWAGLLKELGVESVDSGSRE